MAPPSWTGEVARRLAQFSVVPMMRLFPHLGGSNSASGRMQTAMGMHAVGSRSRAVYHTRPTVLALRDPPGGWGILIHAP